MYVVPGDLVIRAAFVQADCMRSNMGYFAVCMDTEGNVFGLWEEDPKAR